MLSCQTLKASDRRDLMDKQLLAMLVCPICKSQLQFDQANKELICKADNLAYPIVDQTPVMLPERARRLPVEA